MLDPQAECPDCGGKLGARNDCRSCGWKPAPSSQRPAPWTKPADPEPLTEEESAALKATLANLYAKFGAPVEKLRKTTLAEMVKRCPACANGKLVHGGVRYCAACYAKL